MGRATKAAFGPCAAGMGRMSFANDDAMLLPETHSRSLAHTHTRKPPCQRFAGFSDRMSWCARRKTVSVMYTRSVEAEEKPDNLCGSDERTKIDMETVN